MYRILVLLLLLSFSNPFYAQEKAKAITFEIPVLPEFASYLELFAVPGYAALALENNGLNLSLSSTLVVRNRESLQIKAGKMTFTGRRGAVFSYEAGASVSIGIAETDFTLPVELDATDLSKGMIKIHAFPPLAKAFPEELINRIEFKIRSLANLQAQKQLLGYLNKLNADEKIKSRSFEGMLEAIVIEAYNRNAKTGSLNKMRAGRESGDSESLSDQSVLLISVLIWLVCFPAFVFFLRARAKSKTKRKKPA